MRTLVIGAGIAGLTLAARLGQQGRPPLIVERSTEIESGYAIGLYPLGSCVLHGLGSYDRLLERARSVERYELADGSGRVLQAVDMSVLTGAVGPMLMVSRADLVRVLEATCTRSELRRGVTVEALVQRPDTVEVTFDDGTTGQFDAVVACDGIASPTRTRVFGPASGYDSGWVLWTWWAGAEAFEPDVVREYWGAGCFFGQYPTPGRVMCAAGGPVSAPDGDDARSTLERQLSGLIDHVPTVRAAVDAPGPMYSWAMSDIRSGAWVDGRVALCGDAAVGFLPTAGVGASNAMRAAAGLADELSRADAAHVPPALGLYEQRCRSLVERNQTESRRLARVMFVAPPPLAWLRDQVARRYPAERMLGQIIDSMRQPF
jgi:2-polyprenyl-6-methoxyphenol hydroxylase-like FAD-dependent oxidoreductase